MPRRRAFRAAADPQSQVHRGPQGLARSLLLQDFTGGGVIFRHVHTLTVQTPEDLPWALDGEFDPGGAQVEIHNLHRRLTFLI